MLEGRFHMAFTTKGGPVRFHWKWILEWTGRFGTESRPFVIVASQSVRISNDSNQERASSYLLQLEPEIFLLGCSGNAGG